MNIKASELRIGNYYQQGKSIFKITEELLQNYRFWEDFYDKKIFNSIPITKDWLNGFGIKNGIIAFANGKYIQIPQDGYVYLYAPYSDIAFSCKINYIHQLQNLYFALTGKEIFDDGILNHLV